MRYRDDWELDTIPTPIFRSEQNRRMSALRVNRRGGPKLTCTCGACRKCKLREYQRNHRKSMKQQK